ncbi:MAG TPA: hypothetical protein VFV50_04480 [Bdellovibrionales bacterium]|nr:hypothetical protein [Bdellovibrionales bacterium]
MKGLILFAILVFGSQAHATGVFSMMTQSGGPNRTYPSLPFYFDVSVSQNQAKAKSGGLTAEQTLIVLQTGATFALGGPVFAGVTYDYRTVSQFSETNATDGNQSGKREFFAPVVGARFYNFVLKVDYQTSGDYKLDRKTAGGADIAYGGAKGYRGTLLLDLYRGISVGAVYETVSYELGVTGGVAAALPSKLDVSSFGLGLAYVY